MKALDLFSGIGGFALGFQRAGIQTVQFVERDKYCQRVLAKNFPNVPIHGDIYSYDATALRGTVDIVSGGFPCQPFSVAGQQRGKEDDRHLWPQMLRIIKECQPRWVLGENVPGIIKLALDDVLSDLESEGYTTQAFNIPACAVNAPHRRDRVWIVAHSKHYGPSPATLHGIPDKAGQHHTQGASAAKQFKGGCEPPCGGSVSRCEGDTANADRAGFKEQHTTSIAGDTRYSPWRIAAGRDGGGIEPTIRRGDYGISDRVDRIKALGNAVVPQIPYLFGMWIKDHDRLT